MSVTTNIDNQPAFDRATTGLMAGGVAAGAVTAVLGTIFNASMAGLGALAFGVVVGLATYLVDDAEDDALIGLLLCIGGGVVLAAGLGAGLALAGWLSTGIAGALIGLGVGTRHMEGHRRLFWTVLSALGLLAARFTTLELLSPQRFSALESVALQQVLSSGIWGLFLAGAVGTGFVRVSRDEVLATLDRARSAAVAPVDGHLTSARELYAKIIGEIERGESTEFASRARAIAVETVEALSGFAVRYTELRDGRSDEKARVLRARAESLDRRIEQARSPELAAQLEQTQAEVLGQIEMQEELELACVRLEARGQRCVTMLERLHVTLVQNASGELENTALTASFDELEHLADEVQMKSLSVEELLAQVEDAPDESAADSSAAQRRAEEATSTDDRATILDGADGSLDEGTDGATLDDTQCESSKADERAANAPESEEKHHAVQANHESC